MAKKSVKILFTALLSCALIFSFATFKIAAEEISGDIGDDPQSSAVVDEPSQYEPQTEYIPDETEQPREPETSRTEDEPDEQDHTEAAAPVDYGDDSQDDDSYTPVETQSAQDEYLSMSEKAQEYKSNNSVKMDKSVSDKTYSTDYTAGVVSWICVGVGVVVIIVMLVSTKISGRKADRRRI